MDTNFGVICNFTLLFRQMEKVRLLGSGVLPR